jgi:hypothetical protein
MKKYSTFSGREITEDKVIEEFVDQDWHIPGELELLRARVDRLTELLSKTGSQAAFDYAVEHLGLREVKY